MDKEKLKGYLFGLMTAVCWATSPVFIQQGIRNLPSYLWGTAVGLSSAALIYFTWLLFTGRTELQKALQHRDTIVWSAVAGAAGGLGILARNTALGFNQVAVVIALAQTTGLFSNHSRVTSRHLRAVALTNTDPPAGASCGRFSGCRSILIPPDSICPLRVLVHRYSPPGIPF